MHPATERAQQTFALLWFEKTGERTIILRPDRCDVVPPYDY